MKVITTQCFANLTLGMRMRQGKKERMCNYNFKNQENQEKFKIETNKTGILSRIFESSGSLDQKSGEFLKELNHIFSHCFEKIRVTNKIQKDPK